MICGSDDIDRNDNEDVDVDVDYDNDWVPATKLGTNSDHSVYTHFKWEKDALSIPSGLGGLYILSVWELLQIIPNISRLLL